MEKEIINGIIYCQLDDVIGPNPYIIIPSDLSEIIKNIVAIKSLTVLSGEGGLIPESLVILPFTSIKLKGIIKYLKWVDESKRGNVGKATLTLLFNEADDLIFYKYKGELEVIFNDIAQKIISLEESKANKEALNETIKNLREIVLNKLESLKIKEMSLKDSISQKSRSEQYAKFLDYKYKISLCGDPGSGKTSLILRFTNNAFTAKYIPTLGVNVSDKITRVNEKVIQLVLWDIAGQKKFEFMRTQFYQGSNGIFLVFDLTNPKSFDNLMVWYQDIKKQLRNISKITGFIIGNKSDLHDERKVMRADAEKLASELNLNYFETSALTGDNVEVAFYKIAEILLESTKK